MSRFGSNFRSRRRTARAFGTTAHAVGTTAHAVEAPAPTTSRGVNVVNSISGLLASVGSVFTGWGHAKGNQQPGAGQTVVIPGPGQQQNNTALWVGIIVVAAVVGGLLWWIVKTKK